MTDPVWFRPDAPPAPVRIQQRGELLFEFYRERDHSRWRCELRDHGAVYGIEAQFYQNEEWFYARRFDSSMDPTRMPREMAIAWADEERKAIERGATSV